MEEHGKAVAGVIGCSWERPVGVWKRHLGGD